MLIYDNSAQDGGGVCVSAGWLGLLACSFCGNTTGMGGLGNAGFQALGVTQAERKAFGTNRVPQSVAFPSGDLSDYVKRFPLVAVVLGQGRITDDRGERFFVVRGRRPPMDNAMIQGGMIATSGDLTLMVANNTVVLGAGSVTCPMVTRCLVVSGGDIAARGVTGCMLIARGSIRIDGLVAESTLLAGGDVQLPKHVRPSTTTREKVSMPLDFIRFFETASVGARVIDDGGVRVKNVSAYGAFARAGLRMGDLIATADGKDIASAEAFRRLVRTWLGEGGPLRLGAKREGRGVEVTVVLPEATK